MSTEEPEAIVPGLRPPRSTGEPTDRQALDRSFAGGVAWSAVARLSAQAMTWVVTILVARILAPTDYGVIASASIFIGLMRTLTEFGLGTAIVAQRSLTDRQIAQLGGMALLIGLAACAVAMLVAQPVAELLHMPQLRGVLPILGVSAALTTLNALPSALLQRRLDFRRLSSLEMVRALTGSITLLIFAASGFGYWSLVLNELSASAVFALLMYVHTRYSLAFPRFSEIRSSLRLSSEVMASRLAFYLYSNADLMVVSMRFGAAATGTYSMAWTLTSLPSEKINSVIMSVTPGIFAQAQHSDEELSRYFLLLVEGLAIVLFPATVGMAVVAPDLVPVVLGDKWLGAIPLIQVLAIILLARSIAPTCTQVLIARMRGTVVMHYAFAMGAVLPIGFLIGSQWGSIGVAWAWAILFPPLAIALFRTTCREINIPLWQLGRVLAKPAIGTLLMSASVIAARTLLLRLGVGAPARLALLVAVGALVYGVVAAVTMKERARSALAIVRRRRA